MYGTGQTFISFLNKDQCKEAFCLMNTNFIGGFFVILNPKMTGYYNEVPVMEVGMVLVPYECPDISQLFTNDFIEEVVTSKKVCLIINICNLVLITSI
jgi:hypothetical protein